MKIFYVIMLAASVIFFQSCEIYFIPCTSDKNPEEIKTILMPVKTGNKWEYNVNTFEKGTVTETTGMELEISDLDEVYYKDTDLKKHFVKIYRVKRDGVTNTRWGYLKCEDGAALVKEYGYSPKELEAGRTLPDNIKDGWIDPRDEDIKWSGPEKVTVPAGTFDCWACEFPDRDNPKILIREYYSKGVGLVKSQSMNWKRTIQKTIELTTYKVN